MQFYYLYAKRTKQVSMDPLVRTFRTRLQNTPTGYVRDIHDKISWESRLTAILGARGVGKSTLVLQHIKLYEDAATTLYVSADDLYFSMHTLVELAGQFYRDGGKVLYFISTRYTNIRTGPPRSRISTTPMRRYAWVIRVRPSLIWRSAAPI